MGTNSRIGKVSPTSEYIKTLPDSVILVEAAARRDKPLSELIVSVTPSIIDVDLDTWKAAELAALNVSYPEMNLMYDVYRNINIDLLLSSHKFTRLYTAQQAKFNIVDENNNPDPEAHKLLEKQWFLDFQKHALDSLYEHFRLLEIFDFDDKGELIRCTAVNKYHVKSNLGIVTKDPYDHQGISYLEGPLSLYYIPVGTPLTTNEETLGLLYKVVPVILAIKYAIGTWSEFNEKMGIPFRTVTTEAANAKRQEQLGIIMSQMGSSGWAVLNKGEEVKLLDQAGTNPTQCFKDLIDLLDARVATFLLGQSSTSSSDKNKGTYGSLKALAEISDRWHEADCTMLANLVNDQLFPRLAQVSPAYKILATRKFVWDKSEEMSVAEVVDYVTQLSTVYDIDPEFVTQKTGIPILGKKAIPIIIPKVEDPKKKSPVARFKALDSYYSDVCCTGHIQAAASPFTDNVLRVAKLIFSGQGVGYVDQDLLKATAQYLVKGILSGFKPVTDSSDPIDVQLLNEFQKNVYVFSGFKTYEMLRVMTDLLVDDTGKVRTWNEYKKQALNVDGKYNQLYLRAEYDNAVVSASQGSYWNDIQKNKDTLPMLKFVATLDDRTTATCRSLDGVIRPADDEFWKTYFLPLHWRERSLIQQLPGGKATDMSTVILPELQEMFKGNVGITGAAFPDTHPYYDVSKAAKKEIEKEVNKAMPGDL